MKRRSDDNNAQIAIAHPRATFDFLGHGDVERTLLHAYQSGRMPHAWLIGGPRGVGKATLAYRLARFVLTHPDPQSEDVQTAADLAVDPAVPAARRIAAQGHGNLLILERTLGDNNKMRTVIAVNQVRETLPFFGATAAEPGWRVCIVDTADDLNAAASNALLKVLEEPPPRALFLVLSHAPGGLLATIRSRCRRLTLSPLLDQEVTRAAARALARDPDDADLQSAAQAAHGSVGRAVELIAGASVALRDRTRELLNALPDVDPRALHALGDMMSGTDPDKLETFVETVNGWMRAQLSDGSEGAAKLIGVADAWETFNRAARDADIYNLERKPLVFSVFRSLADVARR